MLRRLICFLFGHQWNSVQYGLIINQDRCQRCGVWRDNA